MVVVALHAHSISKIINKKGSKTYRGSLLLLVDTLGIKNRSMFFFQGAGYRSSNEKKRKKNPPTAKRGKVRRYRVPRQWASQSPRQNNPRPITSCSLSFSNTLIRIFFCKNQQISMNARGGIYFKYKIRQIFFPHARSAIFRKRARNRKEVAKEYCERQVLS